MSLNSLNTSLTSSYQQPSDMLSSSTDPGPLSDVFKAKVTSLVQEQLKPIVTELATQQQRLLTNLALLKHNHNVNDHQMIRLENIRDLEQSINFKVAGALGFCSWKHPSMGTNLREPVPADPLKIPRFIPIDQATPAERAVESAALIKEAGVSARRLGVPLTTHDFPREPVEYVREDTMHSSVPLFGLAAPRWRQAEGLPPHDGVWAEPKGNKRKPLSGSRLLDALDVPTRRGSLAGPLSTPTTTTGSRSPRAEAAKPPSSAPARTGLSRTSTMATIGSTSTTTSMPRPPPLRRCGAMALIGGGPTPENADCSVATLQSAFSDARSAVQRAANASASVTATTSTTVLVGSSSLGRTFSTTATIGSPPPPSESGVSRRTAMPATAAKIAKAKAKSKSAVKVKAKARTEATGPAGKKQRGASKRKSATATSTTTPTTRTTVASAPAPDSDSALTPYSTSPLSSIPDFTTTSRVPALEQPKPKPTNLKRGRRTAELDSSTTREETEGHAEPPRKRRKRAAAPSPSPSTVCGGVDDDVAVIKTEEAGSGGGGDEHLMASQGRSGVRRSMRVTRASAAIAAAATQPVPAPVHRGQATKGKKAKKAKARS